jgi:hypothetical protein
MPGQKALKETETVDCVVVDNSVYSARTKRVNRLEQWTVYSGKQYCIFCQDKKR